MSDRTVVNLSNVYLTSDRGFEVFQDLNFSLKAERSAIITGAAGSGKSLLVELLIGRRFADSGSVEVLGEALNKPGRRRIIKRVRRQIGGVGGIFALVPSYTVSENITFPLVLGAARKKVRKERLMKMLTEFSLLKQAGTLPQRLTRVEHTLVQLARATVANQPLIIIDEPLAGLDQKTYERIYEYMVKLALSGRSMIILSGETLPTNFPNTDRYQIMNGALV
ncbi:MAG: ATP-binding cassette domain-containing protein [Candidatus Zixiibacteriota bacterium]|nr:MAG: ATP-binding cassette domain-containing protein [candidate division Zixibacteria bacterium]